MTGISFYCFLWRLISVRRVRASNGRQNRFFYRSHRNGQSRKNIVFMRLCGVSGIHFLRHGEQIILLFFTIESCTLDISWNSYPVHSHKFKNFRQIKRFFFRPVRIFPMLNQPYSNHVVIQCILVIFALNIVTTKKPVLNRRLCIKPTKTCFGCFYIILCPFSIHSAIILIL